ncbi:MAG: 3-methyl-2-oxobutanoate dehydrogenase subunit VorB [Bacillota bacterium]
MSETELQMIKGNEAVAEAAVRAGCRYFFGYPITPQNELPEYMSGRLAEVEGTFLQAESEVAAINMVYGAGGSGVRVMTSSSSPGISLKQEGISYIAGAEVPCVIVNMVRGGPGLGSIQPAQSDYFQATKGGGHGDYRLVVLGPSTLQELVDLTYEAFDIADRYRNPVMILGDGVMGQMMEPVRFPEMIDPESLPEKEWATTGRRGREESRLINSLYLDPEELWQHNLRLAEKYREIEEAEVRYEVVNEDADFFIVAYGTTARIARRSMVDLAEKGYSVGLVRPISLWPFPRKAFDDLADTAKGYLTVEMSMGQMVEDVRLSVDSSTPVSFYGTAGGIMPHHADIAEAMEKLIREGGDDR